MITIRQVYDPADRGTDPGSLGLPAIWPLQKPDTNPTRDRHPHLTRKRQGPTRKDCPPSAPGGHLYWVEMNPPDAYRSDRILALDQYCRFLGKSYPRVKGRLDVDGR